VSQLNGVRSAKVMIVLPENRLLFSETKTKPTASVFVEGSVSAESVNSIRFLVANSVEGLRADDVAVVDHRGTVLTENLKDDPQLGAASSQIKLRKSVEDYFSNKVESMLAKVLGPGAAVVRVSATLDSESISRTEERFDPDGQVLRSETNTEDSTLTNETEAGKPTGTGVTANSANADSGKPGGKNSEQLRKNRALNYEINRVTTNAIRNPGSIANLSAAVFVAAREKPRTPAEMESLRKIVSNAIGIKGVDEKEIAKSISLEEVTFQVPVVQPASALDLAMAHSDWIKNGVAIAIALGLIMMFMRMLKRAAPDQIPIEVLNPPPIGPGPLEEAEAARNAAVISVEALNEMIRQRPGNIGAALRDWMAANGKN
jgi:flagellar M-ring protein FliF